MTDEMERREITKMLTESAGRMHHGEAIILGKEGSQTTMTPLRLQADLPDPWAGAIDKCLPISVRDLHK